MFFLVCKGLQLLSNLITSAKYSFISCYCNIFLSAKFRIHTVSTEVLTESSYIENIVLSVVEKI